MIKINLCPIDELESQYWYVPDVVAAALVAAITYFGTQYYLGTVQDQIDTLVADAASLDESTAKLTPDLEKFKNLGKDISDLNTKLHALKSITVSKIAKYKPVIVLEHLQNLRPEGVWFESLRIGYSDAGAKGGAIGAINQQQQSQEEDDAFEIRGQAFDNILTAEFMTAIRSTESQELDSGDLRTQVYFNELSLIDANIPKGGGNGRSFPELAGYPVFNVRGHFKERVAVVQPFHGEPAGGVAPPNKVKAPADPADVPPPPAEGDPPAGSKPGSQDVSLRHQPARLDDEPSDAERSRRF